MRRHRRRLTRGGAAAPSVRSTAAVAVREANPRTLGGLAAQGAAVAGMSVAGVTARAGRSVVAAGWRHRMTLAPSAVTSVAAAAHVVAPGPTAWGVATVALTGLVAGRVERSLNGPDAGGWAGRELCARGVSRWSAGALAWAGGSLLGLPLLQGWHGGAALAVATVPGAVTWLRGVWTPGPPVATQVDLPPVLAPPAHVLQAVLTQMTAPPDESGRGGGWWAGGTVVQVLSPAPGVAVALVRLPHGMHSSTAADESTRLGLEAVLSGAGAMVPGLGILDAGSVQLEAADVLHLRATASWSRELDEGPLPWRPPAELVPAPGHATGQVWLGLDDARAALVVPSWYVGDDDKLSVVHVWIIGRSGGGKSTTIRVLVGTGLISGLEALILVDGKGDSLADLAPWSLTGAVARDPDSWRQAILLAYEIMVSRQQRLGTPQEWRGPTPGDPIITLVIDESATVATGLTSEEVTAICEMGRLGRSLGVRTIQSGQIPLVDSLIGGSQWRSQARLVLGHGVQDRTHNHVATQSDGSGEVSLVGLPVGRVATIFDGQVLARRAKVTLMTETDLRQHAGDHRPTVHAADRSPVVEALLELSTGWANSRPQSVIDTQGLLAQWTDLEPADNSSGGPVHGNTYVDLTAIEGTAQPPSSGASSPVPTPRAAGARGDDRVELRRWLLSHLLVHPGLTRADLVRAAEAANWSRSGAYKALNAAIDSGAVIDDRGTLTPAALWQG